MSNTLFNREVDLIQKRHAIMFPDAQRQFINMRQVPGGWKLSFEEGYKLDLVITLEIQMAFKMIFAGTTITEIIED